MIYAELWRRDIDTKYETENRKKQLAEEKNRQRNKILDSQFDDLMKRKNDNKHRTELEKKMLNEKWSQELQNLKSKPLFSNLFRPGNVGQRNAGQT